MTLTRRTLITSAPLLAGAPWLRGEVAPPLPPLPPTSQHVQQLSPALLAHTARALGLAAACVHLRTATRQDLLSAADALDLFRAHLAEVPAFDLELRALAARTSVTSLDREDIRRRAFAEIWKYDRAASEDEIRLPEDFGVGLVELRRHGLSPAVAALAASLRHQALYLPVTYTRSDGSFALSPGAFYLRRVQAGSIPTFCQESDLYLNLIGGALGIVALLGCTADPVVFLICPAIGLLATILGAVSFMEWIWCS